MKRLMTQRVSFSFSTLLKLPAALALPASLILILCLTTTQHAAAQQATATVTPTPSASAAVTNSAQSSVTTASATTKSTATDERYRIGPGDVLDIRVLNKPVLSRDAVRVDGRGMIRMPFIEGEIQAACRTEIDLEKEIATRYLKYQKNPQVSVFVKEYQSQPVAVIGAVNAPGRFQLQRRVKLLELLTYAGGLADRAGRNLHVIHAATISLCDANTSSEDAAAISTLLVSYKLEDTLRGDESANPYVRPGDIVRVPDAEQIYIVGNVFKPSAFALKEPITLSRAIAMAGGAMPDSQSNRILITRQEAGSAAKKEIIVDLNAINKRRAEDVLLQPNDIVEVPTNSGKRLIKSILGAVVPAIGQLPVRVIP